ncbi:hypothetical protein DQ04_17571000 [Trypanosoma grayi]|uniref:hypothetical protein n=1 Tax=Trypanosoma grayi TaxID=71804 RepID=UPI0004F442C6|nr:hypothetical protein DQ04_17571000 [Trypanosoma grayi]KEG05885.1 hypothetical protein DQ04_17571000 [Trypanosoma grayi]
MSSNVKFFRLHKAEPPSNHKLSIGSPRLRTPGEHRGKFTAKHWPCQTIALHTGSQSFFLPRHFTQPQGASAQQRVTHHLQQPFHSLFSPSRVTSVVHHPPMMPKSCHVASAASNAHPVLFFKGWHPPTSSTHKLLLQ